MVIITAIKNPLDPIRSQQIIHQIDGLTIDQYLDAIDPPIPTFYSLAISYNGVLIDIENPPPVPDNCSIVFCAVPRGGGDTGKTVAKLVAMLVITVASYGAGSAIAGSAWGAGMGLSTTSVVAGVATTSLTTMGNIVALGIGMAGTLAGSFLLNAILPTGQAMSQTPVDSSTTTYGWDVARNSTAEGGALAELYGEMRISPPLIGQYLETASSDTNTDKQYLHLLFALCRWIIDTPETSPLITSLGGKKITLAVRDVTINDLEMNQFGDYADYYASGNNYQDTLAGFNDTHTTYSLNLPLKDNVDRYFIIEGDIVSYINIGFFLPNGLYASSSAGTAETCVYLRIWGAIYNENLDDADQAYETIVYTQGPVEVEQIKSFIDTYGGTYWSAGYYSNKTYTEQYWGTYTYWVQIVAENPEAPTTNPNIPSGVTYLWKLVTPSFSGDPPKWDYSYITDASFNDPIKYYAIMSALETPIGFRSPDNEQVKYWTAGYFDGGTLYDPAYTIGNYPPRWVQIATDVYTAGDPNAPDPLPKHSDSDPYNPSSINHHNGETYSPNQTSFPGAPKSPPSCFWLYVKDGVLQEIDKLAHQTQYLSYYENPEATLDYIRIKANTINAFTKQYKYITNGTKYIIKTRRYSDSDLSPTGAEFKSYMEGSNKVTLQFYEEVVETALQYPNVALYALELLATDKLSGAIPTISLVVSRSFVYIYNPNYAGYKAYLSTNPAWICYDILHGCRAVNNRSGGWEFVQTGGVDHENIDFYAFEEWAQFCDLETFDEDDPDIQLKYKYTCNIYVDTTTNIRKALDTVGLCGRGAVVQSGTMFTCTVEKPETTPVQRFIFNMSNIETSSFNESWLPVDDRANCIEIKYWDEEDDFKAKTITINQNNYDDLYGESRKTSLDYIGCTNRQMAANFGKFMLNCNRYITLTASWTSFVDAIGCFPGQIIEVQNDVPQFGYGGRLLFGCTQTTLILDTEISVINAELYDVVVYHQEYNPSLPEREFLQFTAIQSITTNVLSTATTGVLINKTNEGTSTNGLYRPPAQDAKFNFGTTESSCILMRILSIAHASDQKRKITAIEFLNEVYEDGVFIPVRNPTGLPQLFIPPALESVTASLEWIFNKTEKAFEPYVRLDINYSEERDYFNIYKITEYRIFYHYEDGDTSLLPLSDPYDADFKWTSLVFRYIAWNYIGKTIYTNGSTINYLGYESNLADEIGVFFIETNIVETSILDLHIDDEREGTSYGYTFAQENYTAYFRWSPVGWQIDDATQLYIPILDWNDGMNYYMYSKYLLVWGFVDGYDDTPVFDTLQWTETIDIGNIYNLNDEIITDQTVLDSICKAASCVAVTLPYSVKFVKFAVVGEMKSGGVTYIDTTKEGYGLDWVTVYMPVMYSDRNILNTDVTEATMYIKMMPQTTYLTELKWEYLLNYPSFDGFAIIYRIQQYWWSWETKNIIPTNILFSDIIAIDNGYIDYEGSAYGGMDGVADFVENLEYWITSNIQAINAGLTAPFPYLYMSLSFEENYEIMRMKLDGSTESDRNVEKPLSIYFLKTTTTVLRSANIVFVENTTTFVYNTGDIFIIKIPGQTEFDQTVQYTIEKRISLEKRGGGFSFNQSGTTLGADYTWPIGTEIMVGDINASSSMQEWPIGTVFSYVPNEFTDARAIIGDTTIRHFLFGESFVIDAAIHATIVAFKMVTESVVDATPGYQRSHYSLWDIQEQL